MITRGVNALVDYGRAFRSDLLLVSDGAGWALDSVARSIARHIPSACRPAVVRRVHPWTRHHVIHFVNRYSALRPGTVERLHRRNRLVVNWSHGGNTRLEHPDLQAAEERLRSVAPYIDVVQVWSSLYVPVVRRLGVEERRIVVLPLGIELDRFRDGISRTEAQRRCGIPTGAACVGSFQRDGDAEPKLVKGPDIFVELATRLHRRIPQLLVLLSGPARGYVCTALDDRGIPYRYYGVISAQQLSELYRACDLYTITAREEGGPLSLLESMASGVPVVSTDVGMAHDLIRNDDNGALVPVGDVDGLERESLRILSDPEVARRLSDRALRDVPAYDWRALAPRYATELYKGCC